MKHFLQLAQDIGFLVILRPGPYICAEWDMVSAALSKHTHFILQLFKFFSNRLGKTDNVELVACGNYMRSFVV